MAVIKYISSKFVSFGLLIMFASTLGVSLCVFIERTLIIKK